MGKFFKHKLPSLLLLVLVHSRGLKGNQAPPPHPGPAGEDIGREGGAGVVYVLSWGVETLAAVTQEAGGVGLGVQVEEECAIGDCQTPVEYIKRVLQII